MSKVRVRWSVLSLCLVALLVVLGCQQPAAAPGTPTAAPIRIGMIAERTGSQATYGETGAKGVEVFVDDLNAKGGLLGRKVEVIYRDSKTEADEAVRQARDLLLNEKVDFLLDNINSGECLGVSDVAKEAKKILFANCGLDDFTGAKGHRYAFRASNPTSQVQAPAMAKYIADNLKSAKTVAAVFADSAWGHQLLDTFKAKMKALNPNVQFVGEYWTKFAETDYSPYITALQTLKPDVTIYALVTTVPFFNQAGAVNLQKQTTLLTASWTPMDDIQTLKQEAFPEGMVVGGVPWFAIDTPANKQFVQQYQAKTNQAPRAASYFQYSTMQFLTEAVKKAGTIETEKVVNALEGLEIETVVGKAKMRPFDHQATTPIFMGKAHWDPEKKMGVATDIITLPVEQLLPTEAEIKKLRGQ